VPTTTLIQNLEFVATVDPQNSVLHDASILIEDDRILAIGVTEDVSSHPAAASPDRVIDGSRIGATPGFVDTHVHLSETLSRAVFPDVLSTRAWVFHWAKPFYAHITSEDEAVGISLGLVEMLRNGTTCFLDMGSQWDAAGVAHAVEELGIRGITGRHAADQKPDEIPPGWSADMVEHHFFKDAASALAALRETVETFNGAAGGRLRTWVNIEGKEPCSLELHVGARRLAEELGVGTTYHIASSIEEAQASVRRHGTTPVDRIGTAGGLGSNLVLAHTVAVDASEVRMLADAGAKVAFCPSTSLKLAKGATAIGMYPEMIDQGICVGLGTDGVSAAGNMNMHRQMYLAAGLFKDSRLDPTLIGATKALRMATIDGANALGWATEIGSLEEGKKADFLLWDLDDAEWTPYSDPIQALVWSVSTRSLAETWVDGTCLFRDGVVARIDESALKAEARERAARVRSDAGLDLPSVPVTTTLYD
jgi:5-methylthioadenosine/S-adenosylhomocysteine deaminase